MIMSNLNIITAEKGKPCVINYEGKIWLEPKIDVDTLCYPTNGLAVIGKNGKYGYINEYGTVVIPLKYKKAYPFAENGLAFVVCENGLGGYIDQNGRFEIEPIYETGSLFRFGMAAVSRNGEYIYIYKNGNKAINSTFKYASGFSHCGLATLVRQDDQHALMDTTSLQVLSLKLGAQLEPFQEGSRHTKFRKNNREALINSAGEIITGFYDKIIISPYNRLYPFLKNELWGYLDHQGNEVIPNIYKEAAEFEEYKGNKFANVKSYHPLAENHIVNLYINEKDEIIEHDIIEEKTQHLKEKFSKVNRFKAQLALAVKKEENEKIKTYIQGGMESMSEKQHNDYKKNEMSDNNGQLNHSKNDDIENEKNDFVNKESWEEVRVDEISAGKNDENAVLNDASSEEIDTDNEEEYESEEDRRYYEQFVEGGGLGSLYEVTIYFRNKPTKNEIYEFLKENLEEGIIIADIKVNYARLLWPIDELMDEGDIDVALYYILDDYRIGQYRTSYFDTYYATIYDSE